LIFDLFRWIEKQKSKTWLTVSLIVLSAYSLLFTFITRERCNVWKDGMSLWSDVIQKDPANPWAYNNRANEFKLPEEVNSAVSDFKMAIHYNPEIAESYAGLSSAYRSIAKYDSATYYADRALAYKPSYAPGYNNRGIAHALNNQPDSALNDFSQAILLQPDLIEAYTNRGNLYGTLGKFNEGVLDYSMALKLNPDLTDAYRSKAVLLKFAKNYDEAISYFNIYFQRGGTDAKALLIMGQCYAAKNDFSNAVIYAQKSKESGIREADEFISKWSNHQQ
jgi:tetratricopeptide (TPR) repeat protein